VIAGFDYQTVGVVDM